MPQGLLINNSLGQTLIDPTIRVGRFLQQVIIPDGRTLSGSFQIPGLTQGIPFFVPIITEYTGDSDGFYNVGSDSIPNITFSGETLNWSRSYVSEYYNTYGFPSVPLMIGIR